MIYLIETDIDWNTDKCVVKYSDLEYDYSGEKTYKIDTEVLDTFGIDYLDNLSVYLIRQATEELIKNRKEVRKEILNVYE